MFGKLKNPENYKGKEILTETDVKILKEFFEKNIYKAEKYLVSDVGSSIIGNCILGLTLQPGVLQRPLRKDPKKKRTMSKPQIVSQCLLSNRWTQTEQEAALKFLLSEAINKFPEYKDLIWYEPGYMD